MKPEPDCKLCPLSENRTQVVMPHGTSKIFLIGEGPGENEDLQGLPFVGRSGKLMDKMMAEAGISRSDVTITNTVKCRPPGNRDPTKEEMAACRPFLESELIGCKVAIGLGKSACKTMLGYDGKMMDVVNKRFILRIQGTDVLFIPTFHPAACIYNKEARVVFKETMTMLKEEFME